MLTVLVVGIIASTWQAYRATEAERSARSAEHNAKAERDRAAAAEQRASRERDRAVAAERTAATERDRSLLAEARARVRTVLDRAASRIGDRFNGNPEVRQLHPIHHRKNL